jgi:hypothetical protein
VDLTYSFIFKSLSLRVLLATTFYCIVIDT